MNRKSFYASRGRGKLNSDENCTTNRFVSLFNDLMKRKSFPRFAREGGGGESKFRRVSFSKTVRLFF